MPARASAREADPRSQNGRAAAGRDRISHVCRAAVPDAGPGPVADPTADGRPSLLSAAGRPRRVCVRGDVHGVPADLALVPATLPGSPSDVRTRVRLGRRAAGGHRGPGDRRNQPVRPRHPRQQRPAGAALADEHDHRVQDGQAGPLRRSPTMDDPQRRAHDVHHHQPDLGRCLLHRPGASTAHDVRRQRGADDSDNRGAVGLARMGAAAAGHRVVVRRARAAALRLTSASCDSSARVVASRTLSATPSAASPTDAWSG